MNFVNSKLHKRQFGDHYTKVTVKTGLTVLGFTFEGSQMGTNVVVITW
jgi:hypothetical protein